MANKKPEINLEDPEIIAEPVQPDAAIKFWQDRAKLTWDEAKGLAEGVKARAFYVTGLAQQDLVDLVSNGLKEALENGETLPEFKKRILDAIEKQGWKEYRVETIFRTNMQSAYAAGRYRKMEAVKKTRPYWQYLAVLDKRVRPSHAILHEKVYPADHDFWSSNYPPNGFRCRCAVITLSERQVKDQGLTVETEMPKADMWTDPQTGMEYFVNFPGADNGFRNNPYKEWAANGGIDDLPGLKDFAPAKKAPVTQKMLESEIADLDKQIKATKNKEEKAALEAKKAAQQADLEKKAAKALKDKITNQNKKLQAKLESFPIKTHSGIWQTDVTTADWAQKAASIQSQKDYFLSKLAQGGLSAEDVAKFQGFLKDLDEFSEQGQEYYNLQKTLKNNQESLAALKKGGKKGAKLESASQEDAYSTKRKDAATWVKNTQEADKLVRKKSGEVWRMASNFEKDAIYDYTVASGRYNRPLSGYEKPWAEKGSGFEEKFYKGPGKVWLDYEYVGDNIRRITELIRRSKYDFDMWLQRGSNADAIEANLGLARGSLMKMTSKKLQELVDREFVNYSFTSCAVNEGAGLLDGKQVIWKIYASRGTEMIYAEPFSHYGYGAKRHWDGKSEQTSFGIEAEMLVQRGATFVIKKVEKKSGKIYMELEIHPEAGYDQPQQDPAEWKGSRKKCK